MVEIRKTTVSEILSKSNSYIIEEYANESALSLMPRPKAQFDLYCKLEFMGNVECFGAYVDNKFIGFMVLIPSVLPHYGNTVLTIESIFVLSEYRKTGAGTKLLNKIDDIGKDRKATHVFMSTPIAGILNKILPNVGYTHTNNVFCKELSNE